jgi:hypothetical protein
MVEGDDAPPQIKAKYSDQSKTAGLLLRLTSSIHHTANYVVLDSGFCVLKALEVGDVAAVEGEMDGVCYNIWAMTMKDTGYVTKIMGTSFDLRL